MNKKQFVIQREIIELIKERVINTNKKEVDDFVKQVVKIIYKKKIKNGVVIVGLWSIMENYIKELEDNIEE